jgi:predicted nucleic acid-binding protein
MSVLVDTGVLLRLFVPSDPACAPIRAAIRRLRENREAATTSFQNIAEFRNVSTRPANARGGYGYPAKMADARVRFIERQFGVATESVAVYHTWRELIAKHGVVGVSIHDARLVALMICSKIDRILTLNAGDFRRYEGDGIQAVTPADVLA